DFEEWEQKRIKQMDTELKAMENAKISDPEIQIRKKEVEKEIKQKKAKSDAASLFGTIKGQFFVGESGTELLFRLVRNAASSADMGGNIVGSSFEHPATRSAAKYWAAETKRQYINVQHDDTLGHVTADHYSNIITPDTRVVTILHASPVTGISVDLKKISEAIRSISPEALIIVDGVQYAAHGGIKIDDYDIDGYAISPYKMYSRHGYGFAWVSDRLTQMQHEQLLDGPSENWELGTRDTGSYATLSDVVEYLEWLGEKVESTNNRTKKLTNAAKAIAAQETSLTELMINGEDNIKGLKDLDDIEIIGGEKNPNRKGLVSFRIIGSPSQEIVDFLNVNGIRTHVRKADHYSGNILNPLGWEDCVRVSVCHYNSSEEIKSLLLALNEFQMKFPIN
ncbi:MAG: aminotransferase class V-fold PLP-dependent enzyme, partial [Paracoccaceae bacterium]|nr:aminotransferase class V-fold PLP-dependent enzyme [Paracoccaceae bacterium]